jgi:hypothetical protein
VSSMRWSFVTASTVMGLLVASIMVSAPAVARAVVAAGPVAPAARPAAVWSKSALTSISCPSVSLCTATGITKPRHASRPGGVALNWPGLAKWQTAGQRSAIQAGPARRGFWEWVCR